MTTHINSHNLYYVKSGVDEISAVSKTTEYQGHHSDPDKSADHKKLLHVHPSYEKHRDAIDLIRWCLAVAKIPADSPRFAYYVSRWVVPEKIARAKADGTFDEAVSRCPPINPDWVRFVPKALAEFEDFKRGAFKNPSSDQSKPETLFQKFQVA